MKMILIVGAVVCLGLVATPAFGQRPGPKGNRNRGANNGQLAQGRNAGQLGANMGQRGQMPSISQLAQTLLTNFDADGSGELNQVELQAALAAMRAMMQNSMMRNGGGMQNQQGQRAMGNGNIGVAGRMQAPNNGAGPRAAGRGGGRRGGR